METQTAESTPLTTDEQKLLDEGTLTNYDIQARPREYYSAMRKGDPVHYDKGLNSWLVTRHEDIWAVQSDPITFSVKHGYSEQQARGMQDEFRNYLREHGGGYLPDAIMSDPPYHTRIRKLMEMVSHHDFGQIFITDTGRERVLNVFDSIKVPVTLFEVNNGAVNHA